tara:strand:- start:4 stop:264 length:261 start_codon:yes stop_codon:yes gene_type:complete
MSDTKKKFVREELQGAIFKNKNKTKDNQPDYTGDCKIDGTIYNISCWVNESKSSGEKYFGCKFQIPKNTEEEEKEEENLKEEELPF